MMATRLAAASIWALALLFAGSIFAAEYTQSPAPSDEKTKPAIQQEKKEQAKKNRLKKNELTEQQDPDIFDPGSGPPSGSTGTSGQPQAPCPPPAPRDITPPPAR